MPEIKVRKANITDLKTIQNLNNSLFEFEIKNNYDSYVEKWAFSKHSKEDGENLLDNECVIIAEAGREGIPVGYLAGSIYRDKTYSCYSGITAELENMFVKEEYRKFGVGSKLIDNFTNYCKSHDASRIIVTASFGNNNAIEFYKKNGFNDYNIQLRKEL